MIDTAKEPRGQIYELLPKVMADIGGIIKTQRNTGQGGGYNFRGIDDALNHCNPALVKHGITASVRVHNVSSEAFDRERRDGAQKCYRVSLLLDLTFHAPDGSFVTNTTAGEALDYGGDKATNKAMAAAMKYGLFFGLIIPVDRQAIDDSDRDEHDEAGGAPERRRRGKQEEKLPMSDGPGDHVSVVTKARSALTNALTLKDLDKYFAAINKRTEDGEFTADEFDDLKKLFVARMKVLMPTKEAATA